MGEDGNRYVGGLLMFAVKSASVSIDYSDPCMALCGQQRCHTKTEDRNELPAALRGNKGRVRNRCVL